MSPVCSCCVVGCTRTARVFSDGWAASFASFAMSSRFWSWAFRGRLVGGIAVATQSVVPTRKHVDDRKEVFGKLGLWAVFRLVENHDAPAVRRDNPLNEFEGEAA